MEVAGGCHDDCVHLGICYELVSVSVDLHAADQIGSCLCACLENVTYCYDFRALDLVLDPLCMLFANHTASYDTNLQHYFFSFQAF